MARRSINKTLYNNVYPRNKPPNSISTLHHRSQRALYGLSVYRFVFTTNVAFGAALLLCLSLLLQPVAFTYAQENNTETPIVTPVEEILEQAEVNESDSGESDSSATDEAALPDNVSDNGDDEADIQTADAEANLQASDEVNEQTSEPADLESAVNNSTTSTSVTQAESTDSVAPASENEVDDNATTSTSTQPTTSDSDSSSSDTADSGAAGTASSTVTEEDSTASTTTEEEASNSGQSADDADSDSNSIGSSTPAETPSEPTLVSNVQTDNMFAFNKNECTEVQDGSFYCQKISYDTLAENDLFAAPDATGDMEIYVIQNGEQMKITDNAVDDASPYYDTRSKTIVWHRLVADRYQIISYDIETGTEEQITDTSVNNMEPTRNGSYTVWQRWVQNNWEIILLDDGVETQITDSIEHDIAPHIRGDLIIWNVRSSDGTQSLMTYDIGSEVFNEIKDTDGVSVANPRMLVMYEAQYQNGDTVMKGFDLVTGEVIPIERIPRELPADIPSPETTGEVRALPTNPQSEEDLSSDTDLDTDEPVDDVVQYAEDDLVLTASSTATTTPVVEVADFDLDLRPDDSTQGTTTNNVVIEQAAIPDVVVPEFNQEQVDTQASSTQDQ
jgi:hypothetical protein